MRRGLMNFLCLVSGVTLMSGLAAPAALAWVEPARGSAERKALLDVARPLALWSLGAPVEFQVSLLRVEGDLAFAVLIAQRPGGGGIDLAQTPLVTRDDFSPDMLDGARLEVLYKRSGGFWVPVLHAIGATDAWFTWEPICAEWRPVLAEYCS